jgi:arylsulfatase A-like enzyme
METCRAVRTDRWKYVARHPEGPNELYDMQADPQERFNLFGQPQHAEEQRRLAEQLAAFFSQYVDPQYDIWKGGRSKAARLVR